MVFPANVVSVLIASPGDTIEYRDAVEHALHQWNADRAKAAEVVLLPLRWEVNAVPVIADSPQAAINKQLLERADVVVGLFWARLGQATERHPSGTVEEILEAADAGKRVHVYFSNAPVPHTLLDPEELTRLATVKQELGRRALYAEFASGEDLKTRVRTAIESDLVELNLDGSPAVQRRVQPVSLRASYQAEREPEFDSRGRLKHRTRNQRIEVTNDGEATARSVRVSLEGSEDGDLPLKIEAMETPRDIPAKGSFSYPIITYSGVGSAFNVKFTWLDEDGNERTSSHSLSLR